MIRLASNEDKPPIMAIAEAIDLFSPQEIEQLGDMLTEYFNKDSDGFWIVADDGIVLGVAYCAPEPYTDGTWNLYFIAVRPDRQGEGIGTQLLQYVEATLNAGGERLLLVETSGLANFDRARGFYRKHGFEEVARIREFYRAGEDKIVFRKALSSFG